MKEISIYTGHYIIEGTFDYSGNILSYLNHFDNIKIKTRKIQSTLLDNSIAKAEESSELINFHPQNILFVMIKNDLIRG